MRNSEGRDGAALPGGFWGELSEAEREALVGIGTRRTFRKGDVLCHEGDRAEFVVVLLGGFVKVYTTSRDGHEAMVGVRGPGDIVLEIGPYSGVRRTATVEALDQLRGLVMDGDRFRVAVDSHPRLNPMLYRLLMSRQEEVNQPFAVGTEQRLARLLLRLSDRFGVTDPSGWVRIDLPLSQTELASWIGKSREMVARAYRSWRDAMIVSTGRRTITIIDLPELRRVADDEEGG